MCSNTLLTKPSFYTQNCFCGMHEYLWRAISANLIYFLRICTRLPLSSGTKLSLDRWHRSYKLLQRTQVQFLAATWWFTTVHHSSPTCFSTIFCDLQALQTQGTQIKACRLSTHAFEIKINKCLLLVVIITPMEAGQSDQKLKIKYWQRENVPGRKESLAQIMSLLFVPLFWPVHVSSFPFINSPSSTEDW